ncbi:hypothetical protein E1292_31765 [Nonomuraea deserti]|uniref:Uncharacterized protein n=1 Tax=Nonomuraea deserti TaxID=1848322 RepID=A0A4R4VAE6_9ACTN|nr:hypothetical protein [Nonomuraea deserti]TDC99442.1 hypothetical protein E1292_31765 [Nonomuraea deserti]
MTERTLTFKVTRDRALDLGADVWVGLAQDAPGSVSGETLAELREEAETIKHGLLGLAKDVPVKVQFVFDLPGVTADAFDSYRETRAHLVEQLRQAGLAEAEINTLLNTPDLNLLQRTA